ncbi:hypothetical protein [Cellulosimicrobium sp. Marseille-Q8652]
MPSRTELVTAAWVEVAKAAWTETVVDVPAHTVRVVDVPEHTVRVVDVPEHIVQVVDVPEHTVQVVDVPEHTVRVVDVPEHTETVEHPAVTQEVVHPATTHTEWTFQHATTGKTRQETDPNWNAESNPNSVAWYRVGEVEVIDRESWSETVVIEDARTETITIPATYREETVPATYREETVPATYREETVPATYREETVPATYREETVPATYLTIEHPAETIDHAPVYRTIPAVMAFHEGTLEPATHDDTALEAVVVDPAAVEPVVAEEMSDQLATTGLDTESLIAFSIFLVGAGGAVLALRRRSARA